MTQYMPLFRSCSSLWSLTQLHAHLVVTGLHKNPLASTKLIESYAQMGSLQSSRLIFGTFTSPDSFMWGVIMKCHLWNNFFEDVVSLYHHMISLQTHVCRFVYPSVLCAASGIGDMSVGKKVHGRIIKCGLDSDTVIETSLLGMYGELCSLGDARKVFDKMGDRDVVSFSSIISSYVENGEAREGLEAFRSMVSEGIEPDSVSILSVAEACAKFGCPTLAKSVHGHVIRKEMESDRNLNNFLLIMYSQCDYLWGAETIFENLVDPSTASWTSLMSSYNQSGCFQEAINLFIRMQGSKVETNAVTMISILNSCARLRCLREGKSVHCFILRKAMDSDLDLGPALIDFYAACQKRCCCEKLLHLIGNRNVITWNTLISLFAREGLCENALVLFAEMLRQGIMPDSFSLASSISASANVGSVQFGQLIHSHVLKRGLMNEFVHNSLIDMYSKCGFVDLACMIFEKITQKSVVTWNCMMSGFSQNGMSVEALTLFDEMYFKGLEINEVTLLSAIQACSNLGYLEKGKWIHHKIITWAVRKDLYIDTTLTDMYAKCGDLRTAQGVFDSMSEKSVVSWSTMISGYGIHGQINAAISLFTEMVESGIKPNEITFMNILSACSHAGSVEEGKLYFKSMKDYGIKPNTEHFASIVDLLSRAGDINGAYDMIKSMCLPVDASIWGALLNGCRIHRRMDLVRSITRELGEISTDDTGYYTLLSNIYAEEGNWVESRKVRSRMEGIGLQKVPGYSTIEIENKIYRFGAGDTSEWQIKEIYMFLENFQSLAREHGCDVGFYSRMYKDRMGSYDNIVYELAVAV
ncbi:putative pentatricopeptide repeat-containing protein At1g69350, mitochondrial [Prosopis cineraria]|uniref:putative pentatricopeptide repeat-containing protein At1g69350, mitochondrial n=1 Tax=Prosopis cineraria TaxID=364024 RepID=UPI00240FE3F3|nr:putative pentatricopeptide repeat-containing protein At1g69350, mitochondrial [Prosopis cineraria]